MAEMSHHGGYMMHMSFSYAHARLRICSDICLFLYTSELPLLFLIRGKRLLKDWMVILDIEPCLSNPFSSQTGLLSSWARSIAVAKGFQMFQ